MKKKGIQLNQAFEAVLTLTLVAILVVVAIFLVSSLQTNMKVIGSSTAINESVTRATLVTTGINLTANNQINRNCGAITGVNNGTVGGSIGITNFTQSGCRIINETDMSSYTATSFLFNYPYTYTTQDSSYNATSTMITQFATYPALVGLVGTIIFLALVIGVLVASFAFGSRRGA